jgi:hypothetical protein
LTIQQNYLIILIKIRIQIEYGFFISREKRTKLRGDIRQMRVTRDEINNLYSVSELLEKKQILQDQLALHGSIQTHEIADIKNLISTINQRLECLDELLGVK